MRVRSLLFVTLLVASVSFAAAGSAIADPDDAPFAITTNLNDQLASEQAYADYLASTPQVTCNPRIRAANGTPQIHEPNVGAVFAKDAAEWSVQCASISEPLPHYDLLLTIAFQEFNSDTLSWDEIEKTKRSCSKPSVAGQAVILDCINVKTYSFNHSSLNKFHRAEFCIVSPDVGCFYSDVWYSGRAAPEIQ